MHSHKQIVQLLGALADNMAGAERCLRQLGRVVEALTEETAGKGLLTADKGITGVRDRVLPDIAVKSDLDAEKAISGTTLTVTPEKEDPFGPKLVKKFGNQELWFMPCIAKLEDDKQLGVYCDNRWGVRHPNDATEELIERLQEDHGV